MCARACVCSQALHTKHMSKAIADLEQLRTRDRSERLKSDTILQQDQKALMMEIIKSAESNRKASAYICTCKCVSVSVSLSVSLSVSVSVFVYVSVSLCVCLHLCLCLCV